MPETIRKSQLLGIQYLRALAASMVACLHVTVQIPQYFASLALPAPFATERLRAGVDIFFVISGFIMMVTGSGSRPMDFAVRRILRVVPLYWLLTLLLVVLYLLWPLSFRTTVVRPEYVLESLAFIPYSKPGISADLAPVLIPGWTLNLEMYFYLLFTLLLLLPGRFRLALMAVLLGLPVVLSMVFDAREPPSILGFYGTPRVLEFWLGMLIADQYMRDRLRVPKSVCWALIIGGFGLLLIELPPALAHSESGLAAASMFPAAVLVLGVVGLEKNYGVPYARLPALLGDASYSIYLTHVFSLGLLRVLWPHVIGVRPTPWSAAAFGVTALAVVGTFAVVTYRLVEKPLLSLLQRAVFRGRSAGALSESKQALPVR